MALPLTSTLLLLLIGLRVTSADLCMSHGTGCRAPFGLDMGYETLFSPSCHRHSICYSCGASLGLAKEACDKALQTGMHEACAPLADAAGCRFQADNVYNLQTRVVGTNFFHSFRLPSPWCVQHGIDTCLPLQGSSAAATTTPAAAAAAGAGSS